MAPTHRLVPLADFWEVLGEKALETRNAYESGWVGVLERYASCCEK